MTIYVGVDPGLSGAIVAIMPDGQISWWDCPTFKIEGEKFRQHDRYGMSTIIRSLTGTHQIIAVIEEVHVDQRDITHLRSAETLIRTAECWLTLLESHNARVNHLTPIEWRSELNLPKGLDKSGYVAEALKLYPECRSWIRYPWRNKMVEKHDRAEALLMCHLAQQLDQKLAA